ncbi:group III truncated hemoglobin [Arenibacter sp. M-2]|uniref:group III truncated hemoglobin n=1 Tax=Arenibacter sp. M-2 TaxID=3053612 RepID=UPI0025705D59|nr:group III truncated hemoglobin [Arenibacter sp. M-2]MDL5514911.1 group III truncated hemoglobin [Arenibacter sp. M-2]
MKRELQNFDDIILLVDEFYTKIRKDELLGPIFNKVIQGLWPAHLNKMYTFWQTVLLEDHTYYGSPFMPHVDLPVEKKHFVRWIELFYATLDEHFKGEKVDEAKWRAAKMAEMFLYKIEHYRHTNKRPLI